MVFRSKIDKALETLGPEDGTDLRDMLIANLDYHIKTGSGVEPDQAFSGLSYFFKQPEVQAVALKAIDRVREVNRGQAVLYAEWVAYHSDDVPDLQGKVVGKILEIERARIASKPRRGARGLPVVAISGGFNSKLLPDYFGKVASLESDAPPALRQAYKSLLSEACLAAYRVDATAALNAIESQVHHPAHTQDAFHQMIGLLDNHQHNNPDDTLDRLCKLYVQAIDLQGGDTGVSNADDVQSIRSRITDQLVAGASDATQKDWVVQKMAGLILKGGPQSDDVRKLIGPILFAPELNLQAAFDHIPATIRLDVFRALEPQAVEAEDHVREVFARAARKLLKSERLSPLDQLKTASFAFEMSHGAADATKVIKLATQTNVPFIGSSDLDGSVVAFAPEAAAGPQPVDNRGPDFDGAAALQAVAERGPPQQGKKATAAFIKGGETLMRTDPEAVLYRMEEILSREVEGHQLSRAQRTLLPKCRDLWTKAVIEFGKTDPYSALDIARNNLQNGESSRRASVAVLRGLAPTAPHMTPAGFIGLKGPAPE